MLRNTKRATRQGERARCQLAGDSSPYAIEVIRVQRLARPAQFPFRSRGPAPRLQGTLSLRFAGEAAR